MSTRGRPISLDRLRSVGLGEQAVKAALAAGLAWALGSLVPGAPPQPYLAPLTAMLTVQLTVAESITGAVQRTIGATVGVFVAVLAGNSIGVNPITIAALVLVGQVIGTVLKLSVIGTSQVMVTALLVLTIGGTNTSYNYGWARIAETIVGAAVGVGINALLVPPSYLTAAESAKNRVVELLVERLEEIASGLSDGITINRAATSLDNARILVREFESARQVLQRAEDSLRFNVRARIERDALESIRRQVIILERSAIQTRTIARALTDAVVAGGADWLMPSAFGQPIGQLLRAAVRLVEDFVASGGPSVAATEEFVSRREAVLRLARTENAPVTPDARIHVAAILATLDRFAADLRHDSASTDDEEEEEKEED